jgi:hypothetical protein
MQPDDTGEEREEKTGDGAGVVQGLRHPTSVAGRRFRIRAGNDVVPRDADISPIISPFFLLRRGIATNVSERRASGGRTSTYGLEPMLLSTR